MNKGVYMNKRGYSSNCK